MQSYPQYPISPLPPPPQPYVPEQYQYPGGGLQPMAPMAPMPSNAPSGMMRLPIAQPTAPAAAGRRSGREIKRRTKTGCLTCRKRRIKCDEGQPTCRNCSKSNRSCMGYDPVFKQQQLGPLNIQPAPSTSSSSSSLDPLSTGPASSSDPYRQPATYPGRGAAYPRPHGPAYENGTSIDPSLGGALNMAQAHPSSLQPARPVKPISIDQLFALNNVQPQWQTRESPLPPLSQAAQDEVRDFYKHHYAPGLDKVFETTWYTTTGLVHLQEDVLLRDFVAQCSEKFRSSNSDSATARTIPSLEARLVWQLASMPRTARHSGNVAVAELVTPQLLTRIDILETLLTGQFLPPDRIPPPPRLEQSQPEEHRALSFWCCLGRFTATRDDTDSPPARQDIFSSLNEMRAFLNLQESRDVLYSVAVARHFGGRMPAFDRHRSLISTVPNNEDEVNRLKIAADFIEQQDSRGTTQVIQAICRMAIRSWWLQKQ